MTVLVKTGHIGSGQLKKSSIERVSNPSPIIFRSFAFNLLWHTVSNALEKSSNTISVFVHLFIDSAKS